MENSVLFWSILINVALAIILIYMSEKVRHLRSVINMAYKDAAPMKHTAIFWMYYYLFSRAREKNAMKAARYTYERFRQSTLANPMFKASDTEFNEWLEELLKNNIISSLKLFEFKMPPAVTAGWIRDNYAKFETEYENFRRSKLFGTKV